MEISYKRVTEVCFVKTDDGEYICRICNKPKSKGNGYTNLGRHVKRHKNWEVFYHKQLEGSCPASLLERRTLDIFHLVEWIVEEKHPLSFVERRLVRKNAKMSSICSETLLSYLRKIFTATRAKITDFLPEKFGLCIDGWTTSGRHFVAIIAVFNDPSYTNVNYPERVDEDDQMSPDIFCKTRRFVLLAFCPLEDKEDMSAQSIYNLVADTLSTFDKPWSSLLFMVGDNCSVNTSIGRKDGATQFIGCASHKFNLAVQDYLVPYEALIGRIHELMRRLSTIKGRAFLEQVTELNPALKNDTRWSSTFVMVKRYSELREPLALLSSRAIKALDLNTYPLSDTDDKAACELLEVLRDFEDVTKTLQQSTLTMYGVRKAFDHTISVYPEFKARLSPESSMVVNKDFENGIIKIAKRILLNAKEKKECSPFAASLPGAPRVETTKASFLSSAFKKGQLRKGRNTTTSTGFPPLPMSASASSHKLSRSSRISVLDYLFSRQFRSEEDNQGGHIATRPPLLQSHPSAYFVCLLSK